MVSSPFKKGDKVEVSIDEEGFRGAWYPATVIKPPTGRGRKIVLEYETLVSDDDETTPLVDFVDLLKVRPLPPREANRSFSVGEDVDAFHNDGWWEGVVMEVVGEGSSCTVYFRASKEQIEFGQSSLRLHREWVNGGWVPPLPQVQVSASQQSRGSEMEEVMFSKGTLVEVSSDEDGFEGAWFAATVVQVLEKGKYLIEYSELRTEDDKECVKEEVDAFHIRPIPPKIETVDRFCLYEEVDALYNDGWWVGVISKVLAHSMYVVYFKTTNEELKFNHDQLRPHQEWVASKWVTTTTKIRGKESIQKSSNSQAGDVDNFF